MANECPVPKGILVIIGGKEDKGNEEPDSGKSNKEIDRLNVLKTFVELTGKKKPVIEVITSASSEGDEAFEEYRKAFEEL